MKKIVAFMLTVLLLMSSVACNTKSSSKSKNNNESTEVKNSTMEKKDELTIGLSIYSADISYFIAMQRGVENYCDEQGYDVIVHDEKMDETEMVSGCINLINQGVDALLVSPFKPESLGPVATLAEEKGIPLIILDIGNGDGAYPYDVFIVSDNIAGGKLAGEYLIEKFKENNQDLSTTETAVITIDPSNVANHSRGTGFKEIMEKNGVSVVSDIYAKDATADATYPVAKNILTANPDISAIFCSNDEEAVGASQAAKDLGIEDLIVIGFDGQETAIDAINNKLISASVRQFPSDMGKIGVQYAVKIINNETVKFDDPETKTVYSPLDILDDSNIDASND